MPATLRVFFCLQQLSINIFMDELIKKISKFEKFDELVRETLKLIKEISIPQISLQIDKNESWDCSSNWLKNSNSKSEFNFQNIHPSLKNSVFEIYLNSLPLKLFRTRIMIMNPKSSYSIHKDPTPRIHIPIVTNEQNAFLFPEHNFMFQMPADGSIFWVDTRKIHTFVNWSTISRIHIVSVIE